MEVAIVKESELCNIEIAVVNIWAKCLKCEEKVRIPCSGRVEKETPISFECSCGQLGWTVYRGVKIL